jgi:hypothetical protein
VVEGSGRGVVSVGGSSRYDRQRPVGPDELAEAEAYRRIATLLREQHSALISDQRLAWQVAGVLSAAAGELSNGRSIPLEIRRSVRGMANTLCEAMDPR